MKEFIEKLIGRLEEHCGIGKEVCDCNGVCSECDFRASIEIVNKLAEEYKDKVMINGQYCWQTCSATEHCKECNRLCNGSIDYYENYDVLAEEYHLKNSENSRDSQEINENGWIPCEKELPEDGVVVLIQDYEGYLEIGVVKTKYGVKGFEAEYEGMWLSANNYLAWHSLQEPYQPKGENA